MIYRAERGPQLFFNVVWGIVNLFAKEGLPYLSPSNVLQSTKNLSTGACKLALQRQTCQCSSPPWFGLILYRKFVDKLSNMEPFNDSSKTLYSELISIMKQSTQEYYNMRITLGLECA